MMDRQHREAGQRWNGFTLAEQLGHIGSEVSRALKWKARNPRIAEGALVRALELIDLTLDDPRQRASLARLRELCRVRETLVDFLVGSNEYGSSAVTLQRYFDAFAVLARKRVDPGPPPG